jgi:nitrate reductase NapD
MHIAGVLLQARPEHLGAVQSRLREMNGIEIHTTSPQGQLVVTVEGEGRRAVADSLTALHTLDGVLSACLVYEESDTVEAP